MSNNPDRDQKNFISTLIGMVEKLREIDFPVDNEELAAIQKLEKWIGSPAEIQPAVRDTFSGEWRDFDRYSWQNLNLKVIIHDGHVVYLFIKQIYRKDFLPEENITIYRPNKELYLKFYQENDLSVFPPEILQFKNLQHLSLHHIPIEHLPEELATNSTLSEIYLHQTPLRSLSSVPVKCNIRVNFGDLKPTSLTYWGQLLFQYPQFQDMVINSHDRDLEPPWDHFITYNGPLSAITAAETDLLYEEITTTSHWEYFEVRFPKIDPAKE
ncbi:MAG: hypothetical protein ACTSRK_20045, partial [Promethearchaeota archaeon]